MEKRGGLRIIHWLALVLAVIGALNWGLIGLGNYVETDWNMVSFILGAWPILENTVYVVVGLAGLTLILTSKNRKKKVPAERMGSEMNNSEM